MENKKKQKLEEKTNTVKLYSKDASMPIEDIFTFYSTTITGLDDLSAANRLHKYGKNEITSTKPKRWYNYLLNSLFSPFNCILLSIVIILVYTDIYLTSPPSYANISVILVLVLSSTLLEFFQEYRSNKAAEKLKELVSLTTHVIRNGKEISIPISNITIGDIILLSTGSMIPADLRIIECKDLYVGQSQLTGESDSVRKRYSFI